MQNEDIISMALGIGESLVLTKIDKEKVFVQLETKDKKRYSIVRSVERDDLEDFHFISSDCLELILKSIIETIVP